MNKRVIIIGIGAVVVIGLGAMKLMSNKKAVEAKLYIRDASEAILVESTRPTIHTFESSLSF